MPQDDDTRISGFMLIAHNVDNSDQTSFWLEDSPKVITPAFSCSVKILLSPRTRKCTFKCFNILYI